MEAVKTYNVNYYRTTREEVTKGREYVNTLMDAAYNAATLAQVTLAQKAYEMDERLFNKGIDKFMFRRELDNYVSDPNNGVKLRKLSEYDRFLPPQVIEPVRIVEQYKGDVLVLSFDEEVVDARPEIKNPYLSDGKTNTGSYFKPKNLEVVVEKVSFDPIIFGTLRSITGEVWEKVWILGAWINYYPTLTTSESIVAAINNMFSLGNTQSMKLSDTVQPRNFSDLAYAITD